MSETPSFAAHIRSHGFNPVRRRAMLRSPPNNRVLLLNAVQSSPTPVILAS